MSLAPSFEQQMGAAAGPEPARTGVPYPAALPGNSGGAAPVLARANGFEADLGGSDVASLIDLYLQEQRQLSAVERFSQRHANHSEPLQAHYYRDLLPVSLPKAGQQYAFEVDLDRCSGCKGCVSACHSLNGLDDNETWREVGFLVGHEKRPARSGKRIPLQVETVAAMQTVTTACHHCVDPGCMSGCPVLAYEKDPVTGIVRHLDDQCIGCTYCVMKCPYDVPKYSPKRGIVRKCDMCQGRLAAGEAPACVQACPSVAIAIRVIDIEDSLARAERQQFLPASPDPRITKPTTRYITHREGLELTAADSHRAVPQPTHWPLVFLLILSQLGAGGFLAAATLDGASPAKLPLVAAAWIALQLGLISSVFHLGQPLKAWRGFLGWRRSWLSRELMTLSAFAGLATTMTASLWLGQWPKVLAASGPLSQLAHSIQAFMPGWWLAALTGLAGVFTSVMVYVDTRREFWNLRETSIRFFGTAASLGSALAWICTSLSDAGNAPLFGKIVLVAGAIRLFNAAALLRSKSSLAIGKTVSLHLHHFAASTVAWLGCWAIGGFIVPALAATAAFPAGTAIAAFAFLLAGDILERKLFFTTVAPVKMPGGAI